MQQYLRSSNTDAVLGISPFEVDQQIQWTRWLRIKVWVARWARRLLPFLFLLVVLRGEELNPQIPDKMAAKYWKARADLAVAIQDMVTFCHGDIGFDAGGNLACVVQPVPAKPASEEKK